MKDRFESLIHLLFMFLGFVLVYLVFGVVLKGGGTFGIDEKVRKEAEDGKNLPDK